MGSNKSPGNDGLTKAFYICFLMKSYPIFLMLSILPLFKENSQHQAMITLIGKKGKDKRYLKNWRPISPINADAKIASIALAFKKSHN